MTLQDASADDLTRSLVEPDPKYGKFVPDSNDPFVQRYIPADSELQRIEAYLKDELDGAYADDGPVREKKLALLAAYHAEKTGEKQIITLPLVKRAVNQNVAWITDTIMQHKPLVTVTPDSNDTMKVLVEDPTYGPVPLSKSSEEVAAALEIWLEYKLRKCLRFRRIVQTAAMEAKRGQVPTWLKIEHHAEMRQMRAPKYEEKGPVAVTFQSKKDIDIQYGEATSIENVSTYSMLMPADEQDPQAARWIAQKCPQTNESLRASLYNGDYFLIDKSEREEIIGNGASSALSEVEERKAQSEKRIPNKAKPLHDIWEVWLFWTVPMKQTLSSVDQETGEAVTKTITINQEYSMVARFHRTLGRLLSLIRNPFDHGMRPYVPVWDRKEPFRHSGGSLAEDVAPIQKVYSELNSLEIRGGVIATTPISFSEPGSMAGEWIAEHPVEPGDNIPRQRADEIEFATLGERPQSLLGLMEHHYQQFQQDTSLGDLQLGLNVPGRTPASSIAQVLNQGETQAAMFLEDFRLDLSDAIKLYVQTVQQYLRFGEVIPFDPETTATVKTALEGGDAQTGIQQIPVRFPQEPLHKQFAFDIAASAEDRTKQNEFERLVSLKKLVDSDGSILAQMIGPLASGKLPPAIENLLIEDFKRREFAMELIAKAMRKDGKRFSINPKLMTAMVEEQQQMKQMAAQNPPPPPAPPPPQIKINLSGQLTPDQEAQAAQVAMQNGAVNGPQTGPRPMGAVAPGAPNHAGGLGGPPQQPGVPQRPPANQPGPPPNSGPAPGQ